MRIGSGVQSVSELFGKRQSTVYKGLHRVTV